MTNPSDKIPTFQVDSTESAYAKLTAHAQTIEQLLTVPWISTDQNVVGALDELLGTIYSLIIAQHLGYKDRVGEPIVISPIKARANAVGNGVIRMSGTWMAGYYMNSGIYRTASLYHRVLKIVTGNKGRIGTLTPIAQQQFATEWEPGKTWTPTNLELVRKEANRLKHVEKGLYTSRGMYQQNALNAVDELIELLKAWCAHRQITMAVTSKTSAV